VADDFFKYSQGAEFFGLASMAPLNSHKVLMVGCAEAPPLLVMPSLAAVLLLRGSAHV
jgi:hypothetical protein